MRKIARALVGSFLLTILLATPALAQGYPPGAQTIEVSDSTVFPCGTVTVTGENLVPGTTVNITFDGEVIGSAVVGADGTYSTSVTIPCDTAPGTYVLGAGGVNTQITVLAAGGAGGGGVPGTGANLGAGIFILGGLLVLGVTALVLTRRREKVAQPQPLAE
jgi:LPXTG-motif cell wall-anchored protein